MRGGRTVGAVLVVGTLAGCGGLPTSVQTPLTLREAPGHYETVLADVRQTVDGTAGPLDWTSSERELVPWTVADGHCPYWSPEWQTEVSIATDDVWSRVVENLEPVLAEHGFEVLDHNEQGTGGWAYFRAEDGSGAVFTLRSKGSTELGVSGGSVLLGAATACPTVAA